MEQKVGTMKNGWELIEKYERFNLWINLRTGVRECFYHNEYPQKTSI